MENKKGMANKATDHLTNEMLVVLSQPGDYTFRTLFTEIYNNLKERNAVSGGEEMLRLRAYEKLQNLVTTGLVTKEARKYSGRQQRIMEIKQDTEALNDLLNNKRRGNNRQKSGRKKKVDILNDGEDNMTFNHQTN